MYYFSIIIEYYLSIQDLEACICKDYEEFGHKCVREVPQNCLPFFCKKSVKVEHSPALGWILTPNRECTIVSLVNDSHFFCCLIPCCFCREKMR